ncbi:hypothetical protein SLEP1_g45175 [Rubroshorea leprosula]|uniref:Uncharacterized protein n=1 Tax=Rubroshorea leprosula TaxID=152421 RepID=A0AAV5LIE7_9ROSI|nr:hypothetical protein SLEP1_g45175 [Rubroshorea leprosula]
MFCQLWELRYCSHGTVHGMFGYVEIDRNSTVIGGSVDDDFSLNLW